MNNVLVAGKVQEEELCRIMEEHGTQLLRLCYMYVKDKQLAEDAVQETFLKVFQKYPTFRHECSEKSWITRIALNSCKDILRTPWIKKVDRTMPMEERLKNAHAQAAKDGLLADGQLVLEEVTRLPAKYKDVILLRYYENMKLSEIAQALRISERTVRTHLQQANKRLHQRLKGWYFNEE